MIYVGTDDKLYKLISKNIAIFFEINTDAIGVYI